MSKVRNVGGLTDEELADARENAKALAEYFRPGRIAQGVEDCPNCKGAGRTGIFACNACGATGRLYTQS